MARLCFGRSTMFVMNTNYRDNNITQNTSHYSWYLFIELGVHWAPLDRCLLPALGPALWPHDPGGKVSPLKSWRQAMLSKFANQSWKQSWRTHRRHRFNLSVKFKLELSRGFLRNYYKVYSHSDKGIRFVSCRLCSRDSPASDNSDLERKLIVICISGILLFLDCCVRLLYTARPRGN